jgi:hypothetical protein
VIVSVMPDFGGTFCWLNRSGFQFDGVGSNIGDSATWAFERPVSADLCRAFGEWIHAWERTMRDGESTDDARWWAQFHRRGLALTRDLKAHLGPGYRVCYVKPLEDPTRNVAEWREIGPGGRALLRRPPARPRVELERLAHRRPLRFRKAPEASAATRAGGASQGLALTAGRGL